MTATRLALLLAAAGCGGRSNDPARFIPSPTAARIALTAALDAWKQGKPTGAVAGTSPVVQVVDETRLQGQKLVRYEIVGEIPGPGPRTFTVSLETENPGDRRTARYVVTGIDPLWVYRQEDYDKLVHWEMNMTHDEPEAAKPKDKPK